MNTFAFRYQIEYLHYLIQSIKGSLFSQFKYNNASKNYYFSTLFCKTFTNLLILLNR